MPRYSDWKPIAEPPPADEATPVEPTAEQPVNQAPSAPSTPPATNDADIRELAARLGVNPKYMQLTQ